MADENHQGTRATDHAPQRHPVRARLSGSNPGPLGHTCTIVLACLKLASRESWPSRTISFGWHGHGWEAKAHSSTILGTLHTASLIRRFLLFYFGGAGVQERLVVQGVHMTVDGKRGEVWKAGEARRSRLLLIGRHLCRASLEQAFLSCCVSAP